MAAISFMSEHTAEYVLIPRIIDMLSCSFPRIVPFYFWSTREGNTMSRQCGPRELIRLVCVYARRPKIEHANQERIVVKMNAELFAAAEFGEACGVPVFAGVPVVSSIADLTLDAVCSWFRLMPAAVSSSDVVLSLTLDGKAPEDTGWTSRVEGPLDPESILRHVFGAARKMTWDAGIDTLRELRTAGKPGWRILRWPISGIGGYKPFHLILMET